MEIKRCYETIIGASVGENQLINPSLLLGDSNNGITVTADTTTGEITVSGTATANATIVFLDGLEVKNGHVYCLSQPQGASTTTFWLRTGINTFWNYKQIEKSTNATVTSNLRVFVMSGQTVNFKIKPQFIDLTAELGSTIADYIYSLESATAGSGIAKLREWGFLRGYQAYNAGSLESVEVTGKKIVGFNCWNGETDNLRKNIGADGNLVNNNAYATSDYIPVLPNTTYYAKNVGPSSNVRTCFFYDSDKNPLSYFSIGGASGVPVSGSIPTTDKTRYVRLVRFIDQTEFCFNLSSDRNGEYEAYAEQSYDYGDDTLRGIFKLDANNNLYADGDRKTSDGTITRYYGTRAYQSGDESLADAITDGTTTVYKLTTPTTEHGDPFPSPQVCYPDGTEEYATSNGVPVGHETRYEL